MKLRVSMTTDCNSQSQRSLTWI